MSTAPTLNQLDPRAALILLQPRPIPNLDDPPDQATIRELRRGLMHAGARRQLARRLTEDAVSDLSEWVRAAAKAGLKITHIAEWAGLSRQAVYDILDSKERGER